MVDEFAQEARLFFIVALGVEPVTELFNDGPVEGSALDEPQKRADGRRPTASGSAVHKDWSQVGTLADFQPRANLLVAGCRVIRNRKMDRLELRCRASHALREVLRTEIDDGFETVIREPAVAGKLRLCASRKPRLDPTEVADLLCSWGVFEYLHGQDIELRRRRRRCSAP